MENRLIASESLINNSTHQLISIWKMWNFISVNMRNAIKPKMIQFAFFLSLVERSNISPNPTTSYIVEQ